jgi:hypothetical protein
MVLTPEQKPLLIESSDGPRYTQAVLQLLPAFALATQALATKVKFAFVNAKLEAEALGGP